MSDTARDYQTIETASAEGMDALFDVVATTAATLPADLEFVATVPSVSMINETRNRNKGM